MNKTKLDKFWEKAFQKLKIIETINDYGKFEILASQIKNLGQEPRLMTKFDNSAQLPSIFKQNNLSILPTSRGSYVLAPYKTFFNFPEYSQISKINHVDFPDEILSISPSTIHSEANAISCAYISGIIEDFVEDINLKPTVNGRMRSGEFYFYIQNSLTNNFDTINVNNSQIEIDGGYEGAESLTIIEAKNNIADDFIVRQLYYPYRKWNSSIRKKINTVYMIYSNNIFHFYNYIFEDTNNYNSLCLKKYKKYTFEKINITLKDIEDVLHKVKICEEPNIPFPQADKFERIINLMELLNEHELSKEEITNNYAFDRRQTDYYVNAGKYLNLFSENQGTVQLTDNSKQILCSSYCNRQLKLVNCILSHKVFKDCFEQSLNLGRIIDRNSIITNMKSNNLYHVNSDDTYNRRSSTIASWLNWILGIISE